MTGATGPNDVRARLARVLTVVALLAGLALGYGVQCADGMIGAEQSSGSMSHTTSQESATGAPGQGHTPSGDGMVATCLAVLIGIVAAAAALGLRGPSITHVRLVPALLAAARSVAPSAPSLEKLCLSRT